MGFVIHWHESAMGIDAFKLWCWRLLRVPWTARRSNQSILKEVNPEYSLEGLMQKLKLQYFGHLMQRANSLEKTLMLGRIEGRRRRGWQRIRWLEASPTQWTWVWANSRRWGRKGKPGVQQSMKSQRVRHDLVTEQSFRKPRVPQPCWASGELEVQGAEVGLQAVEGPGWGSCLFKALMSPLES